MWRLCKYVFYVSYCIEQQKKWNGKKSSAFFAAGWTGYVLLLNLFALVSVLQMVTGIPFLDRAVEMSPSIIWIMGLLFSGFCLYFVFPGKAEAISTEFDKIGKEPEKIKRQNLYIWLELFVAVAVFIVCVVVGKALHH